ncbi:MAG: TOBE domain-containing protein, partial [Enterococcus sp.]
DIHTEQIVIDATPEATVRSEIVVSELLGAETMLYSKIGDTEFVSRVDARDFHQPGEKIDLAFDLNKSHFFDSDTQEAITLP